MNNNIFTKRLILRKAQLNDAADLFPMRSDPEVMRYIPRPLAKNIEDVEALLTMIIGFWETGERLNWMMENKATGKAIGMVGFVEILKEHNRAELGYMLDKSYHRQGYMTEAISAIVNHGFNTMGLHTIFAIVDEENKPSMAILEQAGFNQEGIFREDFLHNGEYRNSVYYGKLKVEH